MLYDSKMIKEKNLSVNSASKGAQVMTIPVGISTPVDSPALTIVATQLAADRARAATLLRNILDRQVVTVETGKRQ